MHGDIYKQRKNFLALTQMAPHINEHLDWAPALQELGCKVNEALALLNHRARACGNFHFKTYSMLFNQLILPTILTNACIWGHYHSIGNLLGIQPKALRFLLGIGMACPLAGLFGETGRVPLSMLIKHRILKLYRSRYTL